MVIAWSSRFVRNFRSFLIPTDGRHVENGACGPPENRHPLRWPKPSALQALSACDRKEAPNRYGPKPIGWYGVSRSRTGSAGPFARMAFMWCQGKNCLGLMHHGHHKQGAGRVSGVAAGRSEGRPSARGAEPIVATTIPRCSLDQPAMPSSTRHRTSCFDPDVRCF
jgi:hypothetical protein